MGKQKPASFYKVRSKTYKVHYTESAYHFLYKKLVGQLPEDKDTRIIDLGCGAGQVAHMIHDQGYTNYIGVDFSMEAIRICNKRKKLHKMPFKFRKSDFFSVKKISEYGKYDIVIMCEVLEHINKDILLLKKIEHGTPLIISLPKFDTTNHVRHFKDMKQIRKRYSPVMKKIKLIKEYGSFFLITAVRK